MTTGAAAVPDGWRVVRLGEVADERRQRAGADRPEVYSVTKHDGFVRSADYFDRQVFSRDVSGYRLVRRGDFAYATIHLDEGSLGLFKAADAGLISPMYTVFEVDGDQVDRTFLFEYLKRPSMIQKYGRLGDGTVHRRKSIRFSSLARLELNLPPLPEQRRIAAVLDAIDEAIERSQAVVAATEGLRRSLLHELLSEGLPGRHTSWREVAGVGRVPSGWEVVRLGEVCERPEYGAGAPARPFDPSLPRYVRITDITDDGRLRADDARSADPSDVDGYELEAGDLLFARSGATVGKTYLYRETDGRCVYAGYLIRFRAMRDVALPEFLELWTRSEFYGRWVASMLRAGAQPNINAAEYSSLPVALPPLEEQQMIVAGLAGVESSITRGRSETDVLRSLAGSAAEALLSGRVRVGGA